VCHPKSGRAVMIKGGKTIVIKENISLVEESQ